MGPNQNNPVDSSENPPNQTDQNQGVTEVTPAQPDAPASSAPSEATQSPQQPFVSNAPAAPPGTPPAPQNQVIFGASSGQPKKRFAKKRLALIGGVLGLVLLIGGGLLFGLYLPNTPENVYKSGLDRTGKALDKVVAAATEQEKLEALKKSEITGSLEVSGPGLKFSGTFNSKHDTEQSDSNLTYKNESEDANSQAAAIQVLTSIAQEQLYPDIYFKISGLQTLGLGLYAPSIAAYDGKWVSVSADYIKSKVPVDEQTDPKDDVNHQDVAEIARVISATTQEYVFSNETDKAVLVQKEFVGTEELAGGITANHYKVGVNKENAKKYCVTLVEKVMATSAYKKLAGESGNSDEAKKSAVKGCEEDVVKDIEDDDTFDMWIDKKLKLVHKIRFSDKDDAGTYVEIGQNYKNENQIPLFMVFNSDKGHYNVKVTLDINLESNTTKGTLTGQMGDAEKFDVKASIEFKPFDGDVTIEKPPDAIPIQDVLNALGFTDSI